MPDSSTSIDSALGALDEKLSILVLVSGTLKNGESHYAYASIPPSLYGAFKKAQAAGSFKLEEFGSILSHGEGKEPPPEVKQRMTDEFGANHYFEQEMEQLMARAGLSSGHNSKS